MSLEEFHRKTGVPFVKALLEKINAAFDMLSNDPTDALYFIDPVDITIKNVAEYGKEKLEILFDFYKVAKIILLSFQPL